MRKFPIRYFLLVLTLLLIGTLAWRWWSTELPFQRADPLAAIGLSQPLLIALPDTVSAETPYPWQEALRQRNVVLDSLGLGEEVDWKGWWLIPARGEDGAAVYTFIGEADSGLAARWQPDNYGPTLPFGDGDIFTFAYTQAEQLCYARYRNLLLLGRYPFQIEAALRRLGSDRDNWTSLSAMRAVANTPATRSAAGELWLYPAALTVDLPADWLGPAAVREWQQLAAVRLGFTEVEDSTARLRWTTVPTAEREALADLPWAGLPPEATYAFPLPTEPHATTGLGASWAIRLPVAPTKGQTVEPNLWLAVVQDSVRWAQQRSSAELIDYEDYQTYRLERWRKFSPLRAWSGRSGMVQPWTLEIDGQLVVTLEREVLERWLDLQLLGANLALDPNFGKLVDTGDPVVGLLSWSGEERSSSLLSLLFPQAAWARSGVGAFELASTAGGVFHGSSQLQADWRQPLGLTLRWTLPLPANSDFVMPVTRPGQLLPFGLLIGKKEASAQLFTVEGLRARYPLPPGRSLGAAQQLPSREERYLLTTDQGVFQIGETLAPLALPGTIGLRAAASVQLQSRGQTWEWLLLDQAGRLQLGRSDGQVTSSWQLAVDSLRVVQLWWQRDATSEQITLGGPALGWQSYDKQGNLLWEAPYPTTATAAQAGMAEKSSDRRIYLPLVDGRVQVLNRSGQHFKLSAGRGPVDHAVVGQWWGDARTDVVLQRGNLVHLFAYTDQNFSERWQYRLPVVPDTLMAAGELGVMAVHSPTQQLWLLDGEGQLRSGFPIAGSRQALLVRDEAGQSVLLVVADDELYAYSIRE